MTTLAIIQARMASSRLPGKVMLPIADAPMLAWVVRRAQAARSIDQVVVATTTEEDDAPVAAWCARAGVPCYRGHPLDVLDRYYQAAQAYRGEVVVRLTADCPFLDPALLDDLLARFAVHRLDFAANRLPEPWGRSFPIGLDAEVMTLDALQRAWREARAPHQREHVTPYFYDDAAVEALRFRPQAARWRQTTTPRGFRIALLHAGENWGRLRWTVDTPADLQVARALAQRLAAFPADAQTSWQTLLALVQAEPELMSLNAHVRHKTHRDVDDRLLSS